MSSLPDGGNAKSALDWRIVGDGFSGNVKNLEPWRGRRAGQFRRCFRDLNHQPATGVTLDLFASTAQPATFYKS
jgi:hypothetical protein